MTSHDDSPLFVAGLLIAVAWALVRRRWQTWLPMASAVPLLLAMKVNNRRLAWIEMVFAFASSSCAAPETTASEVLALAGRARPVVALYVGRLGRVEASSSLPCVRSDSTTVNQNQDPSALARLEENLNLVLTYIQHPILG